MSELGKEQKSTTIVAIRTEDAVVLAADRQVSGRRQFDDDKLKQLSPSAVIGTSGFVADIQLLVTEVRKHAKKYRINRGRNMSPSAMLQYVQNEIHPGGILSLPDYYVSILFVAYDQEPIVASIGPFGTKTADKGFLTGGSGGPVARGVIASDYSESMTVEEAKELAIRSLRVAADQGVYTGEGIDIAVADEEGVEIEKRISIEEEF